MIIQFMIIGVIYVLTVGLISIGGYNTTSGVEW
jgi:hypothetical protein